MKSRLSLLVAVAAMSLSSCTEPFWPPGPPDEPPHRETLDPLPETPIPLDLDDDGTTDASIVYRTLATMDEPTSAMSTMLTIENAAHCEFIYRYETDYIPYERGEMIPLQSSPPVMWYDYPVDVASIGWHRGQGWDNEWRSEWTRRGQFLPFRLGTDGVYRYGWLEISVDREKGTLQIHDRYCSPVPQQQIRAGEK